MSDNDEGKKEGPTWQREDQHGNVRQLRSPETPEGDPNDKETLEGHLLAARPAVLVIRQWKRGSNFPSKTLGNVFVGLQVHEASHQPPLGGTGEFG